MRRTSLALVLAPAAALLLAACGASTTTASSSPASTASTSASTETCTPSTLQTLTPGKLTIATGSPAFSPWVIDDKPESGKGYESAVAYAVAKQLGYATGDVSWIRTTFDSAIAPGPKKFDFNIQQYTITEDRKKAVDFSSSYYDQSQVVVTYTGSPIDGVTTLAGLKGAKLGVAVGTTSLTAVTDQIAPTTAPKVYNDNAAAVTALKNKQIDGIVTDLPTGFEIAFGELDSGAVVGQLPNSTAGGDQLGLLLAKDSPLTSCVTKAVDALRTDGTLAELQAKWLTAGGAPVLS